MKSFAFGASAALLAAYTIADDPPHAASAEQPYFAASISQSSIASYTHESMQRQKRGLPPFWGRSGVTAY
jgi:hypothetical protein